MTSFASQRPWVLTVLMRKPEMWSGWRIKWFAQLRLGCFICGLAIFLLFIISLLCSRSFSHEVNFNCQVFRQEPIFDRMICVFPLVCKMVNGKLTDRGQTRENEKGARTEICPALTSGNLNGDAPVSSYLFTSSTGRIGVRTALKYGTKPIGYMTLHVRDRRGAAWLCHRNRAATTFIQCVWTEALPGMVFAPAQKLFGIVWTSIRYVTLQFRDPRGAASPCYRNRAEITVLVCEQKPCPLWFSRRRKGYPI